jgi:TrmH family RNA methyltransferase
MITSTRNSRIAEVRRLARQRERRATGRTTIDGPFLLAEAFAAGVSVREVFALPDDSDTAAASETAGVPLTEVSGDVLRKLASSVNPRGPVAVIDIPAAPEVTATDAILLWEVGDPGNAGTVIRSAAAFGFQVLAGPGTVDLWSPKVLRSGVGGHFRTSVVEGCDDIADLDRVGLVPLAMTTRGIPIGKVDLSDPVPVAFVLGNEARGLPPALSGRVTSVTLPMPGGTESLNAGVAASIAMYLRMSRRS